MMDGSLSRDLLEHRGEEPVSTALIEACGVPEIGSRLADLSIRVVHDLERPFELQGSTIAVRPDVADDFVSITVALREAIELAGIRGDVAAAHRATASPPTDWPCRILAHAMAITYAATVLRRRVPPGSPPRPLGSLLAPDVDVEAIRGRPQFSAQRIAAHLAGRDRSAPCPDADLTAATRALPLACPTEVLLASGGDDRQTIDWETGTNSYGIAPRPTPWTASFGSCTASSPTFRAFDAARAFRLRMIAAALDDRLESVVESETDVVRRTILAALGVAPDGGTEVVLTPSGTDAELVALAVSMATGEKVTSILIGPNEVGRGSVPAAAGLHFSTLLPSGAGATPDTPLRGFDPERVEVVDVPVRSADGTILDLDATRDLVQAAIDAAGHRVLLHVVEGSKTGIRAPRPHDVDGWEARHGDRLDVVVDAAQMRIDQQRVAAHLDAGRMIIVTGSKFFGGPPFSGAVLVPAVLAERLRGDHPCPAGLDDYLSRSDVPASMPALRAVARPEPNLGLLARWVAALSEMQSFHNASWQIRDEVLRRLAAGVRRTIDAAPHVTLVESPYTHFPEVDRRGLTDLPTIFTFLVHHPSGGFLDFDDAKAAQHLLAHDLTTTLSSEGVHHQVACRSFHIGQPVRLHRVEGRWMAGLRLAIGAATLSQIVFDHTRGASWQDRIERELSDVRDALDKLALVTAHVVRGGPDGRPATRTLHPHV